MDFAGIKKSSVSLLLRSYKKFFGGEMSDAVKVFFAHLSWSFFGAFIAGGVLFLASILAGRALGPHDFGIYNSVVSLAVSLSVFFLLGIDISAIRFLSDEKYRPIFGGIMTGSVLFVSLIGMFMAWATYFANEKFQVSSHYYFVVVVAFIIAFRNLFNGFLRSFGYIVEQSFLKIIDGIFVLFFVFFGYYLFSFESSDIYLYGLIWGGIFFLVGASFLLRGEFKPNPKAILTRDFLLYNKSTLIIYVCAMGGFIDKFLIGKYIGLTELGIYSAYYIASHAIFSEIIAAFMNVFWPTVISQYYSIGEILKKIDKVFLFLSVPAAISIFVIVNLFFSFFGSAYATDYSLALLFSINTFLGAVYSVYVSLLSINYVKITMYLSIMLYGMYPLSIIIFRDVEGYLVTQILLQILAFLFVRRSLKQSLCVV